MPRRLRILTVIAALAGLALVAAAPSYAVLAAPTPDTTDVGTPVPAFHWTSVSGAAQYQVQISAASDFSALLNPDPNSQLTKNTYYTLTTTVPDCTCYWRVRAVSSTGVVRRLVVCDRVGQVLVGPDAVRAERRRHRHLPDAAGAELGSRGRRPEVRGADRRLAVADRHAGRDLGNALRADRMAGQRHALVGRRRQGCKRRHLGVLHAPVLRLEWPSAVSGLTVTDTVDSTGDSYADDTIYEPRFSWDAVAGAAKYDVDISLDSNFATGSTTRYTTIGTSLSPTAVLENADYYWRVRAIDPASGVGDWTYGGDAAAPGDSFSESYDTQSPSINNLRMTDVTSDPGNDDDADSGDGYQTTEPIVQWDPVPGAGAYVVDVRQYDLNDPSAGCNWSGVQGQKKWLNIVEGNAWTPLGIGLGAGDTVLPGKTPSKDSSTSALIVGNAYCVRVKPVRLSTASRAVDVPRPEQRRHRLGVPVRRPAGRRRVPAVLRQRGLPRRGRLPDAADRLHLDQHAAVHVEPDLGRRRVLRRGGHRPGDDHMSSTTPGRRFPPTRRARPARARWSRTRTRPPTTTGRSSRPTASTAPAPTGSPARATAGRS